MKYNFEKVNQVNIFEGDNNTANYNSFDGDLGLIKKELNDLIQSFPSGAEHTILSEAIDAVEKKDESKFKVALKKLVEIGTNVFSKVTAEVTVAYMRSQGLL